MEKRTDGNGTLIVAATAVVAAVLGAACGSSNNANQAPPQQGDRDADAGGIGDSDGGGDAGAKGDAPLGPSNPSCGDHGVGSSTDAAVYGSRNDFSTASDDTGALVAWSDRRRGAGRDVFAARVSASGDVLDPHGILVATRRDAATTYLPRTRVAAGGGMYLVVWDDYLPTPYIYAARISGSGELLDKTPIDFGAGSLSEGYHPEVIFDGSKFVVAYETFDSIPNSPDRLIVARGITTGGQVVTGDASSKIAKYSGQAGAILKLVAGAQGEASLLWWVGTSNTPGAARLDANLAIAKQTQLTIPLGVTDPPELSFDGTRIAAAWASSSDVVVQRMDRDFTPLDTAPISMHANPGATAVEIAHGSSGFSISWSEGAPHPASFFTAQLGNDGSTKPPARATLPTGADAIAEAPVVVLGGDSPLVVYTRVAGDPASGGREDAFLASPMAAAGASGERRFTSAPSYERHPILGGGGDHVVATWQDADATRAPTLATQKLGADGQAQGAPRIVPGTTDLLSDDPVFATGDSSSIVVYFTPVYTPGNNTRELRAMRIGDDGAALDRTPITLQSLPPTVADEADNIAVAPTEDGFFVVWTTNWTEKQGRSLYGLHMAKDGKVQDAQPIKIATIIVPLFQPPAVACGAGVCAVAWTEKTYTQDALHSAIEQSRTAIVRRDGSLTAPISLGLLDGNRDGGGRHDGLHAGVVWSGDAFLVAWTENAPPSSTAGTAVMTVTLSPAGSELAPRALVATTVGVGTGPAPVFSGGTFTVGWEDEKAGFLVRRVSTDDVPLGEARVAIAPNELRPTLWSHAATPSLVGLANGDVLIAFERFDVAKGGWRAVTRSVADACLAP